MLLYFESLGFLKRISQMAGTVTRLFQEIFGVLGRLPAVRGIALKRCLGLDGELAAVVAAFTAHAVIHVPCATVGAECQSGSYGLVVGSTLSCAGLRLFAFRMCHFLLSFFICF